MRRRRDKMGGPRLIQIALLVGVSAAPALSQHLPQNLPAPPPPAPGLEFTGPESGWPPQVKGAAHVSVLPIEPVPGALTPEFALLLREIAEASPTVRGSLGDRFAFIEADLLEAGKQPDQRSAAGHRPRREQQLARATFYSYSRNVAVRVLLRGGDVLEVTDVEGYQPPESPQEIEQAVQLAREDARIRKAVRDLEGRALLTEIGEGNPGSGHRVLYVSFLARGSADTQVMALVDLTDGRVLDAGRPAGG
jgi:hypothetical protein